MSRHDREYDREEDLEFEMARREREEWEYSDLGDARRCPHHPHMKTSSPDGMFDTPCGECEVAADEDARLSALYSLGFADARQMGYEGTWADYVAEKERAAGKVFEREKAAPPPPPDDDVPF